MGSSQEGESKRGKARGGEAEGRPTDSNLSRQMTIAQLYSWFYGFYFIWPPT
ncbi:MAG: hypothetical protein AAGA60_19410 [Cyanobacteria bacterium P01_E01_bin.42]